MTSLTNEATRTIVSPTFPIEWRDVYDFLGEFGPFNGRYVPRYPNDWIDKLRHHLEDVDAQQLPPLARAALFERLRREIMLCTIPISWIWDDSKSWGKNVQNANKIGNDSMVVGDALDPRPYKNWAHLAEEIKRTRLRSWNFHGLVSEYVSQCTPLLVNSPSAYLVDRYLDPFTDAFENLLISFFHVIKGSKCYRLELITRQSACGSRVQSDPKNWMSLIEIEESMKRIYGHRIPKDRSLLVHLVQEAPHGKEGLTMHDRFFLTIHGAINFGQGFLVVNQRQPMQNAFVVDKEHHALLTQVYINGVARYSERLPKAPNIAYPKSVTTMKLKG